MSESALFRFTSVLTEAEAFISLKNLNPDTGDLSTGAFKTEDVGFRSEVSNFLVSAKLLQSVQDNKSWGVWRAKCLGLAKLAVVFRTAFAALTYWGFGLVLFLVLFFQY